MRKARHAETTKHWFMALKPGLKTGCRNDKRGGALKRIVIISAGPDADEGLLELVNVLFPDCEICIVSSMAETLDQCQADPYSGLVTVETMGRA
jgi:hypothetical protein